MTPSLRGRPARAKIIPVIVREPGEKNAHIVLLTHRGGGWWQGECMGQAKRCRAGECKHLALRVGSRAVRRMPNISERAAAPSNQELGR
jgi:hypothetical protein